MQLWKFATAKSTRILLLMVVFPLVGLSVTLMYILHTPEPSVKAPVAIDRNSLLPHRFAGPCMNCHQIREVGPVPMNAGNMSHFKLTKTEQQLLLAGQRVETLGLSRKLSIPAITRSDILPHSFVGVCSNCHLVLDVHPSRAYMQTGFRHAGQPLLYSDLGVAQIARGGVHARPRRSRLRVLWGLLALPLFGLTLVYIVLQLITRSNPAAYRGSFALDTWRVVHQWCAVGFTAVAMLHWYYSDRGNNFLHLAFVALVSLAGLGCVLWFRMRQEGAGRATIQLHLQRFGFFALIVLVVLGHFFADFR